MSAAVDAIRAEMAHQRLRQVGLLADMDASTSAHHVAWVEYKRIREMVAEANKHIDALVSALHLLGERDVERPVEERGDE